MCMAWVPEHGGAEQQVCWSIFEVSACGSWPFCALGIQRMKRRMPEY